MYGRAPSQGPAQLKSFFSEGYQVEYDQYVALAHRAAQLVEQEQYAQALTQFQAFATSGISDIDKAMAYYNMAFVLENLGQEQEVLAKTKPKVHRC